MRPPEVLPTLQDPDHRPTGTWWERFRDAVRLAVENWKVRRLEGDEGDWYEDVDILAAKDDKKGDETK